MEGTDGRQRVVAHRVKVETGNGVVFHDGAAIEQQRLQRGSPTAGHRPNGHIVQAEVARIVQPVNGKVRLHADLQGAALR